MAGDVQVGANEDLEEITQKKEIRALIVEEVKLLTRTVVVDVPKYKDVEQIKYVTKEEEQTKFNTKEEESIKFIPKEKPTIKYVPVEEESIKFKLVEQEYVVERPVLVDKRYERPVLVDKEYTLTTIKDVDAVKELIELVPKLVEELLQLKGELAAMRRPKLVEEIIKVPLLKFVPTEIERVVWKDVERERCKVCSKEVD